MAGCLDIRPRALRASRSRVVRVAALLALTCVLVLGSSLDAAAERDRSREYALRAAILVKLTKFIKWPSAAFDDRRSPFVIQIAGEDPFEPSLYGLIGKTPILERKPRVAVLDSDAFPAPVHLIFVPEAQMERLDDILTSVAGRPVLVVGEGRGFAELGGHVAIFEKDNRIALEINHRSAKEAGLQVSSGLLKVATVVDAAKEQEPVSLSEDTGSRITDLQ